LDRPQHLDLGPGELARLAGAEAFYGQARVPAAVQARDRVADGLEHPLHLVLPAFVDRELDPGGAEPADAGGRRAAVVELDALLEPPEHGVVRRPLDLRLVDLLDLVARVREAV